RRDRGPTFFPYTTLFRSTRPWTYDELTRLLGGGDYPHRPGPPPRPIGAGVADGSMPAIRYARSPRVKSLALTASRRACDFAPCRSEEHTSELQSLAYLVC